MSSRRRQQRATGQALVEMLAAIPALLAFWFGILLLAKLADVQSAAIQGARFAAFSAARLPSGDPQNRVLESQLREHVFAHTRAPIVPSETTDDVRWRNSMPQFWRDPTEQDRLVASASDVTLRLASGGTPGAAGTMIDTALRVTEPARQLSRGRFDLRNERWVQSDVQVRLARALALPAPLDRLDVALRERVVLLGDSWSSRAPEQVAQRVGALVPTAGFARAADSMRQLLAAVMGWLEPAFRDLCVGQVDPEIVPLDRLRPPVNATRGSWRPRC